MRIPLICEFVIRGIRIKFAYSHNIGIMKNNLIYPELSYKITGVLFKVHNELGRYLNEKQYGDLLENKFKENNIEYEREKIVPIAFDGEHKGRNKIDFLIEDKIVLELKTKRIITKEDYYQVRRYPKTQQKKLGLLVNFRDKFISPKRILNSEMDV